MTDASEPIVAPPELHLAEGDVVASVEEVDIELEALPGDPGVEVLEDGAVGAERVSGFDGIGTRREARERALALLYEAEQKGLRPPASVIDDLPLPAEPYAAELVVGVSDHLEEIDELLGRFSVGWPVGRMPAVDRALLRMATFELGHTDVPVGACISEAVELAKRYSTDDSHTFVNGLLSRLASELRPEA